MEALYGLIIIVVLFTLGFIVGRATARKDPIGILHVDNSDPEDGPYLFLERLQVNPNNLKNKEHVTLEVVVKNFISHD